MMKLSVFVVPLAFVSLLGIPLQGQNTILWEAYNDYRPTENITHANVSGYDLRTTDDGGPLINFATGSELSASVYVELGGDGDEPDDFGASSPFNEGSPAFELFDGKVDHTNEGLPGLRASQGTELILHFQNLDPTKRYNFRGSVSRGGSYEDRWAVYTISGTEAHVTAHIDGSTDQNIITKATFDTADLTENQVAMNSGNNLAGSVVGWDNIEPGADGTFSITAEQYQGPTPFGDALAGPYGYGLNAICLSEIESTGALRIVENPPVQVAIPAGETTTLSVEGESPDPITYQWQQADPGSEDFTDIAGATDASYTTPNLGVDDNGTAYRCVLSSGGFDIISGTTTVEVDGVIPSIESVVGSINFNSVYLTFTEPMKLGLLRDPTAYKIEGLFINDVSVRDATTVRLHTSPQPKAATFGVVINGLEDLAGNQVDPDASTEFTTFTFANEAVGLEIWENFFGSAVDDLRNHPDFPNSPHIDYSTTGIDSLLVFPDGPNNTYGGRFRAWLIPEESGDYHFFLRAEDNGEFRISEGTQFAPLEDIDKEPDAIAGGNNPFAEPGDPATSEAISLEAGNKYAVEVLWKEGNGADRAQLAWRKVGDNTAAEDLEPIPAKFFCYFGSKFFDSDGDGLSDAYEVLNGLDASTNDANGDIDGDGLTNAEEHDLGTAANLADTDGDGLNDGVETGTGIWVSENDTGSDPQIADTDTDTIDDGAEVTGGTDPNKADSDDDTFADNVELALGTDPVAAGSKPNVIIAVDTGTWDSADTWSNGQAPSGASDYVVVNTVTPEVSAAPGEFAGKSLTLIGPGMALRANHDGVASANITLNDTELKVRNSNTLGGSLTLNGRNIFDMQSHDFVLEAALKGAPQLTIRGDDEELGGIQLAGDGSEFSGLITITGTDVIATAPGSLGNRSITLIGGGLTFGYDYNQTEALLKIRGGDFTLGLEGDVTMADLVGVNENDAPLFSLFELAGPGPYTADDLLAAFQLDEGITGGGTLTLTGNEDDSDIDGLSDTWEESNFDNLAAGPNDDPDGDGLSNLAENTIDSDPNDPNDPPLPDPVDPVDPVDPGEGDAEITAITKDPSTISLSFSAGTTFDVEYSEDLENWSVIATDVTGDYSDTDAARLGRASGYYRGRAK